MRNWRRLAVYQVVMREQATDSVPTGTDECYVSVPAVGDHNEPGTLYVTDKKLVFVGESVTDAPWNKIAKLTREGTKLAAFRSDRDTPLVFSCSSLFDSVRVAYVAERCLHSAKF